MPEEFRTSVEFYDVNRYNSAESIQQNLIFGRVSHGHANNMAKINKLINEVVGEQNLYSKFVKVGLDSSVGLAGSRLSPAQRQKLAMARCLLRKPKLVIIDDALSVLDRAAQQRIMEKVLGYRKGAGVLWITADLGENQAFERVITMDNGEFKDQGITRSNEKSTSANV